ncbi:hypothetical protein SAMN02910447_03394 [Ruminococcus sp. YE71]|nr:hypothetical protein SAMN02910446_03461 [Ruminococcus sp. YE78]SFW51678.1 hypothetical protein SAMN02910447_03394 [Ruminococcus sp. YE71]
MSCDFRHLKSCISFARWSASFVVFSVYINDVCPVAEAFGRFIYLASYVVDRQITFQHIMFGDKNKVAVNEVGIRTTLFKKSCVKHTAIVASPVDIGTVIVTLNLDVHDSARINVIYAVTEEA